MAYFSLHAYDADVWIPQFLGLNQMDESLNTDIRYATEAVNVETPSGVLQPHAGYTVMDGQFESRIETLAQFHRRWYTGTGSKDWLVCACGGKLYCRQADDDVGWVQIAMPSGVSSFQSNVWSWVTYEINQIDPETQEAITIDVLLMSNALDGMIMVVPPERKIIFDDLKTLTFNDIKTMTFEELVSERWQIQPITTHGYKFGVIERHAERIWGGNVADEPDKLVYSAVYDPREWRPFKPDADPDDPDWGIGQPEDGAGEINQPTWDGDSFTALKSFGSQLLAFKGNHPWRIVGVSPGEYQFTEQFGGGAKYPATVAVDVERVLMTGDDGIFYYDGMSVNPFIKDQVKAIWLRANKAAFDQMCAVMHKDKYYLALPVDGSAVNNALLVYDKNEKTILYYTDINIESMLPAGDILYATSSSLPGRVLSLKHDSWIQGESSGAATKWVSPWMDFGYKRIQKGGFDLYFVPEVQNTAVTLKFSIQTEKKLKTKTYTVQPLTAEQKAKPREYRGKRLHFGGMGRRFRIIIETEAGSTAPWRLIGGLQLVVETDPD